MLLAEAETARVIFPHMTDVVWGTISFALLFLFLSKYALPRLSRMAEERSERIRESLARAEEARMEAERALEEYRAQLARAREEASRILEEARRLAEEVRRERIAQAEREAAELLARAEEEARATRARIIQELRRQIGDWGILVAEKVLAETLPGDREAQRRLIDRYIEELAQMS